VVLPTRILPPAPAGDAYGELNSRAEASETEIATEDVQSGVAVLGMVSGQTVESIVALREAEESGNTMAVASAQEYQLQPTRPELRIDDDTHVTSSSKFTIDIYEQELFQLRQSSIERLSLTGISTTPFVFDDVERNELESSSLDLFTYMDPIVATAVGTGLVIWLVHAGQIAAAVLSTASAWVQLDPLTVLQEVGVCDEADTSEEKMFDNDKANRPSGDS
jgi:hypothetical protein